MESNNMLGVVKGLEKYNISSKVIKEILISKKLHIYCM